MLIELSSATFETYRSRIERLFETLGENSHWTYPPALGLQRLGGLSNWLWYSTALTSWIICENDQVIAYVAVESMDGKRREISVTQAEREHWDRVMFQQPDIVKRNLTATNTLFIKRLAVHPQYRQQGYGTRLVQTAIEYAHARQLTVALLVLHNQRDAARLYHQLGFLPAGDSIGRSGLSITAMVLDACEWFTIHH